MKPEAPELDWTVLARYLAGESAPGEAEAVRSWLKANPARGRIFWAMDQATRLEDRGAAPVDVEDALRRVKARFGDPEVVPGWHAPAFRVAAAVLLLVGATLIWQAIRLRSPATGPVPSRTYTTAAGQIDSLSLGDGSHVVLGPGSRLIVAAGYSAPARNLELRGEALFDVVHDEAHAFTVRAGGAEIRDLGTTFSVRADEEAVRVVVVSGSVLLQDTVNRVLTLKAGDVGVLSRDRQAPGRVDTRREDDLAWTRARLVFDNASLARVRDDLRRWYGIELVIADSALASRHVTAAFAGETPQQVLEIIGLALGATIERRGDSAIVRLRRPGPGTP